MKALAPNSLIQNRYLIVHLIGKGGMGEVYLAVDQRLGSAVALKRTFFADDEMLGNAFEREARILARLRHPVLPKVSDHFMENGEQYLIMEHIAGDDLAKRLETAEKPFPLSWVLFWADQLLDALAYLHSHEPPIIHRDIKPQNLKLTDENHIVLLDFGLSKNTTGQTQTPNSGGSTGSVVGYTPHYAPMEQIRGTGTNPRSDIYSLSATLYQLMSNMVPADALTRADALLNGSSDPIASLHELNTEISDDISKVILHGMEVSQEKRYSNAKEMQKALRKAYSEMQEAMAAQTIAFTAVNEFTAKIEQPIGVAHTSEPQQRYVSGHSEEATRLRSEQPAEPAVPVVASDATAEYNGPIDVTPRQADVKTEVYHAGNAPFVAPTEPPSGVDDFVKAPMPMTDDWGVPAPTGNGGYSPDATTPNTSFDATTPNVAFEAAAPASPFIAGGDHTFSAEAQPDPYATQTAASAAPQQFEARPQPISRSPVKKKSKAIWVVGGLAALFAMAIVAAGGGWFVYSRYYSAEAQPTPSPEPTLIVAPSPEPTFEAQIDTNSNSSPTGANSNSNTNSDILVVGPTPVPEIETGTRETNPRPSPQIEARKTPTKGTPGVKPTPKPKTSDRTVILQ